MNIYDWLKATQSILMISGRQYQEVRPLLVCKDGVSMSVQASQFHYSTPRDNDSEDYTHIEVWCLRGTKPTPALLDYGDGEDPWAYVPIGVIIDMINAHGGIDSSEFEPNEEAEYYAELERGYARDRI